MKIVFYFFLFIVNYFNNFLKFKIDVCRLIFKFIYIYGLGFVFYDLWELYKLYWLGVLEEYLDEIMYEILGWVSDVLILVVEKR